MYLVSLPRERSQDSALDIYREKNGIAHYNYKNQLCVKIQVLLQVRDGLLQLPTELVPLIPFHFWIQFWKNMSFL